MTPENRMLLFTSIVTGALVAVALGLLVTVLAL